MLPEHGTFPKTLSGFLTKTVCICFVHRLCMRRASAKTLTFRGNLAMPVRGRSMRRVMVIGGSGAGKSWFARRLGLRTGLPVVHMDQLFWEPGWVAAEEQVFLGRVAAAIAGDRWVMEGNYSRTWPMRLARADTVIFLDIPTATRAWRVAQRVLQSHGTVRSDMAAGCPEQVDLDFFFNWVGGYRRRGRPKALALIATPPEGLTVHHLRSPRQVRHFVSSLRREGN